ncbi:MAG: arsenate reductase/protein-tyrosine-phosphatase family protein [Promethearchaeota archaeon]
METNFPYKSILIVCSVNTARSPMAEGFLKDFFHRNNMNVQVKSGGISSHARDGMLISMDAKLAMKELGIILSDTYKSKDLKKHPELIENADLILTLTEKHKTELRAFYIKNHKEIYTIKEFGGVSGDIEDPSMTGLEGFIKARDEIKYHLIKGLRNYK